VQTRPVLAHEGRFCQPLIFEKLIYLSPTPARGLSNRGASFNPSATTNIQEIKLSLQLVLSSLSNTNPQK